MIYPRIKDYPKCIYIKDNCWDVKFSSKIRGEKESTLGLCDPENKIIFIRLKQSRQDILKTFIHELIHAFEDEYEFELPHKLVHELEDIIIGFIIENFEVFANLSLAILGFKRQDV